MSLRRRMKEMKDNKLSAAIKSYLKYYYFADTDEDVLRLTGLEVEDISGFHPGDVEDGCTFVGHLIAKDMSDTNLDTLLVFKDEDGEYIVGSTVGGMIIPLDLKGALN